MNNQETLKRVIRLIKEVQEIGFEYVDKEKSKGSYQNIFGQDIPNIELREGTPSIFYIKLQEEEVSNPQIIKIGETLSQIGGLPLMQEAYYEIIKPFGEHGPNLKWVWNGIGEWSV